MSPKKACFRLWHLPLISAHGEGRRGSSRWISCGERVTRYRWLIRLRTGLLFGLPFPPVSCALHSLRGNAQHVNARKGNIMKAIRWSIQLSSLVALSFALTVVEARADANSVVLENATNGPLDAYTGTGVVIGQVEGAMPDPNQVYLLNQIVGTTNLYYGTPGPSFGSGHATQVAGVMVSTNPATVGVAVGAKVYSVYGLIGPDPLVGATNDDLDFQTNVVNAAAFLASQPNVRVINMSIGLDSVTNTGFGGGGVPLNVGRTYNTSGTSVWERALDNIVSTKAVSIVVAAGNEGDL